MNDQTKGLLLTTIGVLSIIPDSLMVRLVSADTLTFIFLRAAFAGSVILAATVAQHGRQTPRIYRELGRPGLQYAALLAIATFCFIFALRLTSVANALFIVSTSPVFAAMASWFFLGEQFSRRMIWTTFFALIGIAIIALGSKGVGQASLLGDLIAVGAAAALAFAFTTARASRQISMVPSTAVGYAMVALVCFPFVQLAPLSPQDWLYLLILGGMFVPLGTSLMALGPRYITSAEVSLLLLLEAVIAPLLVWYVVGENPGTYALLGGAVVIGTLFVSNFIGLRQIKSP